jgi:PPIC-type PPIASE domain
VRSAVPAWHGGSPDVARVAGQVITVAHVRARVAAIREDGGAARLPVPGSPEARRLERWVAHVLVNEAVVLHEARERGLRPGSIRQAVQLLFTAVVEDVTVTESQLRAYHAANADRFRRPASCRVRHILVTDEPAARELLRQVAAGEDMALLAGAHSLDAASRARGGDLGTLMPGTFAGAFEDAAFGAAVGRPAGPVRTEFGWHVLRVESRTVGGVQPFEQARRAIAADLLAAARGHAFDRWLSARRAAIARIAPQWLPPGDPRMPDFVHRH